MIAQIDGPFDMKQRYFSNIYWHFTGSPRNIDWSRCRKPKDILVQGQPRRPDEALEILLAILKTKKLLASCTERITQRLHTRRFCCVTDIPLMDLEFHSRYYGKVAIGFSSSTIHRRFNPVLYYPSRRLPRKPHIPGGTHFVVEDFDDIDTRMYHPEELSDGRFRLNLKGHQLMLFATEVETDKIDRHFADHLKITDFSPQIGESFYQEREWRHIGDFEFDQSDVEAVIVPKALKKNIREFIGGGDDFRDMAILTWEFMRMV